MYPVDRMYIAELSDMQDGIIENHKVKESYKLEWAVKNEMLARVGTGNITYDEVLCETDIISTVVLELTNNEKNQMVLIVNDSMEERNIFCFTDSVTYYPSYIKIKRAKGENVFILLTEDDGYYWCVYFHPKEESTYSNRVLFIKKQHALWYLYAIKIRANEYDVENIDKFKPYWKDKLERYFYNKTIPEKSIRRRSISHVTFNNNTANEAILDLKIKRLYLDKRTVLLHVKFNHVRVPLNSMVRDDLEILSILPVIYCEESLRYNRYKCVGDFTTGRMWQPRQLKLTQLIDDSEELISVVNVTPTKKTSVRKDSKGNTSIIGPGDPIVTEMPTETTTPINVTTEYTTVFTIESETTETVAEETTTDDITIVTTTECTETTTGAEESTIIPTLPSSTVTTLIPDELIQMILENLELILQEDDAHITIGDIRETIEQINTLLSIINGDVYVPGQLLKFIEELAIRVSLEGQPTAMVVESNIAILMAESKPKHPVLGIRVVNINPDLFTYESFEFYSEFQEQLPANMTEAGVMLPPSLSTASRRVGFVVYRDGRSFSPSSPVAVNSRVISVNVKNFHGFQPGEVVNIYTNPMIKYAERGISRGCGYWEFVQDGPDYWSQDGCTFVRAQAEENLDICRCEHLTHFAEILIPRPLFSELNEDILKIISVVGCSLSIIGLTVIILTSVLIESWRKNYRNQIWLQMCIAIFVMMICYIIVAFADFGYNTVSCMFTGVLLHYSLLASFCWMLVVATKSYRDLVQIFATPMSHRLLFASIFSWGVPAVIVVILISIPGSYSNRFSDINPNSNFCYPSGLGLWVSVYLPVCSILVVNCVLFVSIVRSIGIAPKNLRYQKAGDKREALNCARVSLVLVVFFGLPWFLGLFSHNIVAAYFFTITATSQGFVLFVFIVLGNPETRNLWRLKLRPKNVLFNNTSGRSVTMFY